MSQINITCPHCGKTLNVSASFIGRSGKCPACNNTVSIQTPISTSATSSEPPRLRTLPPVPPQQPAKTSSRHLQSPEDVNDIQSVHQLSRREEFTEDPHRYAQAEKLQEFGRKMLESGLLLGASGCFLMVGGLVLLVFAIIVLGLLAAL